MQNTLPIPRILLVDDEVENLKALERTLRGKFELVLCANPALALGEVEKSDFSVVISDQRMPGMLGTDLLAKIAAKKPLVTRMILTAYTETREMLDAINRAEIYRYITKPWDNRELTAIIQQGVEHHRLLSHNEELLRELVRKEKELVALNQSLEAQVRQRTAELTTANEQLSELAMTDPLTKVFNRRAFFLKLGEEIERSRRYKHTMVVAMIDVDHFKPFNDMEGHVCGDEALKKISQIFTGNLRKTDMMGRYGGEEFILMMPETRIQNAIEICDRLRGNVETTTFQGQKQGAYLTVSIGLATYPADGQSAEDLVKAADSNLYQAKQFGRNRVVHQAANESSLFIR